MNINEIKQLIGKYYEGETSLAEEQILRDFFSGPDVPWELAGHVPVFAHFAQARNEEITDPDFELELSAKLRNEEKNGIAFLPKKNRLTYAVSLAAAIVLLIGVALTFILDGTSRPHYSKSDRLAYAQAREALMIVSSNMNSGISYLQYFDTFSESIEKASMLSKFFEYQPLIINPATGNIPSDQTPR